MTTQNDLVVAAFVASAAYFLLGRSRRELPLVAIALALALGTKTTALFALPALALVALARATAPAGARARRLDGGGVRRRRCLRLRAQLPRDGKPAAERPRVRRLQPHVTARGTISTSARVLYRFIDLSGLPRPFPLPVDDRTCAARSCSTRCTSTRTRPSRRRRASASLRTRGRTRTGRTSGCSVSSSCCRSLRLQRRARAHGGRRSRAACSAWRSRSTSLALALGYSYNPWIGRFMLIPVALVMPLAARLYRFALLAASRRSSRLGRWCHARLQHHEADGPRRRARRVEHAARRSAGPRDAGRSTRRWRRSTGASRERAHRAS